MAALIRDRRLAARLSARIEQWRARAHVFDDHACPAPAAALRNAAQELERDLSRWADEILSIEEAAEECGYSPEHLRRLVREGKLSTERTNGSGSRIQVRRGDLPAKRSRQTMEGAPSGVESYDPDEDARDIAQRVGGPHG
jgi:excisionase family DNA binding protein